MTALAEDMDRSREVVFLEREMEDLTVYIDGDKQIPDILARVPTQSGREVWLVLHLEIQGPGGGDLPERMFYYNSTLRVKYLSGEVPEGKGRCCRRGLLRHPDGEAPLLGGGALSA